MLTCREFAGFLMAFLDGDLDPFRRRLFVEHIERCRDCDVYLESYRATVALGRRVCSEPDELVEEHNVPETLIRSVVAALRASSTHLWHLLAAVAASPLLFFYFGAK